MSLIRQTEQDAALGRSERPPGLFLPHPLVRQGDLQTLLAMIPPKQASDFVADEQPLILDAGPDQSGLEEEGSVRLLAFYNAHRSAGKRKGLLLMLHGWEGCSHSNYNLLIGNAFVNAGYDVVRLNLRDHGPTHHLNRGIFYSTLIEEAQRASERVAAMAGSDPFFIVGASLGGNFALRLAIRWNVGDYPNLRHVIAINPALNPSRTVDRLEQQPFYHRYFRKRWLASLQRNQELYPDLYDFAEVTQIPGMRAMTDWLVKRYSSYADAESYFNAYAVLGDAFRDLQVRTTIVTAANDPIIDVQDFRDLAPQPLLDVQIHPSGGHVGFADVFPLRHALPDMVQTILEAS